MRGRILMVDDEPRILDGMRRSLRGKYPVLTANSGAEGLDVLRMVRPEDEPIGVIVSDMMMPTMNGAQFLIEARKIAPNAVPMILSGQADMNSTIAAVNQANLFRFLTKPCETDELIKALDAALRQYELITSEKQLLQNTLRGAVDVVVEILSLASAAASRRTKSMKTLVLNAAEELEIDDWRLPLAAMLSQIGTAAVPPELLQQVEMGNTISAEDQIVFDGHPGTAKALLEQIPRMEEIAAWIGEQPTGLPTTRQPDEPILSPDASSQLILQVAAHYLKAIDDGRPREEMERRLNACGRYPQNVIRAVGNAFESIASVGVMRDVGVAQLRAGMLLEDDVVTTTGMILLRKGETITEVSRARVMNFAASAGVEEPIRVFTAPLDD